MIHAYGIGQANFGRIPSTMAYHNNGRKGYFSYMELGEVMVKPTKPDHPLAWLTIDKNREKLFFPHQIWAVGQVYMLKGK